MLCTSCVLLHILVIRGVEVSAGTYPVVLIQTPGISEKKQVSNSSKLSVSAYEVVGTR